MSTEEGQREDNMQKYKVGVIGATGYVGQRFLTLLDGHPWFETVLVAASSRSAGMKYESAVEGRWKIGGCVPDKIREMIVYDAADVGSYVEKVDFVFCAVDMKKEDIKKLEEKIACTETPVISNNSANRWTPDVPMMIPEVNPEHAAVIDVQKKRLGTKNGFIAVKPNCSIQSYVPALAPLYKYGIDSISVCTYQAISGAGKTFADWPEMEHNIIPFIGGEEEKSEKEPLKIWGTFSEGKLIPADIRISAQCYRVPVQEGHMAAVSVKFVNKPSQEDIISAWKEFRGIPQERGLPTAPLKMLEYCDENDRPQSKVDCNYEKGMGVTIGRLREDSILDYKFTCLSHNTIRGAAGGAVLTAELLADKGYIKHKEV